MENCSFVELSVILVILSKIRVGGGWKIVRTFATENQNTNEKYRNIYIGNTDNDNIKRTDADRASKGIGGMCLPDGTG